VLRHIDEWWGLCGAGGASLSSGMGDAALEVTYRSYLVRCNEHPFDTLGDFVHDRVDVNDRVMSVREYGDGLAEVIALLPDFHWEIRHLVIDEPWLAAHLDDSGTTPSGGTVRLPEFAVYRFDEGRIASVWGDLDRERLLP